MAAEAQRIVGAPKRAKQEWVVRFTVAQRVEHVLMMVSFAVLMLTGLPQHFFEGSWSQWLIEAFGGIEMIRLIHRFFALIFTLEAAYHIVVTLYQVFGKREPAAMIPTLKDARDAMATIRYSFGLSETKPQYGRYSYRQKFEYWGVVFGTLIMVVTGFLLAYPLFFTGFLPGELIPAAKAVHGWEALLALSIIVIWHMYTVRTWRRASSPWTRSYLRAR